MKLSRKTTYSIVLLITAIISGITSIFEYLYFGDSFTQILVKFFAKIAGLTLLFSATYFLAIQIISVLNKKYPWKDRWKQRLGLEIILVFIVNTIISALFLLITDTIEHERPFNQDMPRSFIWLPFLFITVTGFIIVELQLVLEEKNILKRQKDHLEKENVMAQYKALERQLNPHFLFNSLNALSSLIYKDVKKSDMFIKEFSKVFRYILELNTEPVVLIKKEVEILNSFIFLQKIRYPENLTITIKLDEGILNKYLPPLSLQTLVENSVKHNKISIDAPLIIELFTDQKYIIVSNNYQPRDEEIMSTGIGIENLKEKYKLISDSIPEFNIEDNKFVAKIPVLDIRT